jgi:hypothetical protein
MSNENDAKFQIMELKFVIQMEPDKLIIKGSDLKDELEYVGELPKRP